MNKDENTYVRCDIYIYIHTHAKTVLCCKVVGRTTLSYYIYYSYIIINTKTNTNYYYNNVFHQAHVFDATFDGFTFRIYVLRTPKDRCTEEITRFKFEEGEVWMRFH